MDALLSALLTIVVSGIVAYVVARLVARQQFRAEASHLTVMDLWEALDKAERGFHEPHAPSGHTLHEWAAGLAEAWANMERAGLLAHRLPKRGYKELRDVVEPLADERPSVDQMTKMGILRDSGVHPYENLWRECLPSEQSLDVVRKGVALVRTYASEPL